MITRRLPIVAPAQWHDIPLVGHFDRVLPICVVTGQAGSDIAGPVGACAYATPDTTRCLNKIFFVRMVAVQRRRRGPRGEIFEQQIGINANR